MNHVVLLGDSIFDNDRYVPDGPALIDQLRSRLPGGWKATLLARDGAVVEDVARQVARLPDDATHLVISIGGNNALESSWALQDQVGSAIEGFANLANIQDEFRVEYRQLLETILERCKRTVICTIYSSIPGLPKVEVSGLSLFNDVILQEGIRFGLPIIDLRLVCTEPGDYSALSVIEPSRVGGAKIAGRINTVVTDHDFASGNSVVYWQ